MTGLSDDAGQFFADRYSRQSLFYGIGDEGQRRIRAGRVLVVGCGGLGTAQLTLLVRAGVGHITVVDRDVVESSNLARQILFDESDALAGAPKATAGAAAARRVNSEVEVTSFVAAVSADNIVSLVDGVDVVLDATDNMATRYLINDACVQRGVPWVYGGVVAATGTTATIIPGETACLRCLFPPTPAMASLPTCRSVGVLSGIVVSVAARQWAEAIKLLVGDREHLNRGLSYIDIWNNEHQDSEPVLPQPGCPCCGSRRFDFLDGRGATLLGS